MKKLYTILFTFLAFIGSLCATTYNTITENVYVNDTVVIRLNNYTGNVQWQKSTDNSDWTDISNANADTFLFIADQTTYFRASVAAGTCEPFISEVVEVNVEILNLAPTIPVLLVPENGAKEIPLDTTLIWSCSDPEGDVLTYDVYFDASYANTLVSENQSDTFYTPTGLLLNTTYYWKVVTKDANGNEKFGNVWSYTTIADTSSEEINLAPTIPVLHFPEYDAKDIPVDTTLTWSCSDPEGDILTYDVFFDTGIASTLVSENQSDTFYTPTGLSFNTKYYWKIVAKDGNGNEKASNIWKYTTVDEAISIIEVTYGSVTDVDSNVYKTIILGDQEWMAENLKTTKYNDTTSIPNVANNSEWSSLTTPGYCWFNNNSVVYKDKYGALYNWFTVETDKLCPVGWHVPTDDEWTKLTDTLGGLDVAGGKLKEEGTTHWNSPNTDATNEIGFTALPAGYRSRFGGTYYYNYTNGFWWSADEYDSSDAWYRDLYYANSVVTRGLVSKKCGYSVRCIKD